MKTKTFNFFLVLSLSLSFSYSTFSQVVINDQYFQNQWYLNMSGDDNTRADIRVVDAWNRTMGNVNQKIADIEDDNGGFPINHDDLINPSRFITHGFGFSGEHSTNVVGLIVSNHNSIGIAGVNKFAQVHSYVYSNTSEWADKVRDARLDGNKIINISQGLYITLEGVGIELAKSYNNNIVNVVSVGNNSTTMTYPSIYFSTIAVGSSTKDNTSSFFSNYGPQIEFLTPGGSDFAQNNPKNIFTTSSNGIYVYSPGGTSLAAPLVSGAASLLLSYKPFLSTDDVKNILINSCDKLPEMNGANFTNKCGYGRINLKKAFQLLEQPYELNNALYSIGGTVYNVSDYLNYNFWGIDGLTNGNYVVKRYEVRKQVYFNKSYYDHYAWGQGRNSIGWSSDQPNFGQKYCTVVDGTLQPNNVTVKTYVYEVWKGAEYKGWWPCRPENVLFSYTVVGKPIVAPIISHFTQNPDPICMGGGGNVYVHLSQGNGTLDYFWEEIELPPGGYISPSGNRCYVSYPTGDNANDAPNYSIKCTVSNSVGSDWEIYVLNLQEDCSGCPTLSYEVNGEMVDENPLLITSMSNPGNDVTDYYLLQNTLTPDGNQLNLTIHEPQTEHTWLDNAELLITRVKRDELVAVNDEGQVINYKESTAPVTVLLNGQTDITEILSAMDSIDIALVEGDLLTVVRNSQSPEDDGDGDIILGGEEPPIAKDKPSVKISLNSGKENDNPPFGTMHFRPNRSIIAKSLRNIPPGNLEIEINKDLVLDYLAMVTNIKTARTKTLNLISAVHNQQGDVKSLLTSIDQNYAEILPGESIDFTFQKDNTPAERIAYIIKTVGRYETDTTFILNKPTNFTENNIIPLDNKLFENYPNPFNPSTQIKYSVKENGIVTLKVYDVLGTEVSVLVNEDKPAGSYTVQFNANSLASGIYFYTLSANDFHQTKKMILVK